MPNSLKELRLKTKTPAKDMVAVVQTIYPKYDMTSQSKCENSDAYGICLTQKAMKALYAKFDPDGSIRKHLRTADQHRLKDKLHARITADEAAQLKAHLAADGYYWNNLYRKRGDTARYRLDIPDAWALEIIPYISARSAARIFFQNNAFRYFLPFSDLLSA